MAVKTHGRKQKNKWRKIVLFFILLCVGVILFLTILNKKRSNKEISEDANKKEFVSDIIVTTQSEKSEQEKAVGALPDEDTQTALGEVEGEMENFKSEEVFQWDSTWAYADYSKIHSDDVTLYRSVKNRKEIVIAVNAGHGTKGGSSVYTLCHPDSSPKVTGGSTAAGAIEAPANSEGTTFLDGTPEADATLQLALVVKEDLLQAGYDVLMLREFEDAQIDNIARTVYANNLADCHISLHYDSTDSDKGFFYISVPNVSSYRSMEPVVSHWKEHNDLGEALLAGVKSKGIKIFGSGFMEIDLTQTSYSTVPSVDIEVGDRASSRDESTLHMLSEGIINGLDGYFMHK